MHALLGQLVVQTDRLRDLADQLLDLSQIESGGAAGPPERFDPRERLEELVPRGSRATAPATCAWWSSPASTLVVDPVAFDRVAANLILNALRYGAPPVEVRGEPGEPSRLVVEDHGPGVAPEFVPPCSSASAAATSAAVRPRPAPASGSRSRRPTRTALGGKLAYEPAQPRGARFTLSLPAARS